MPRFGWGQQSPGGGFGYYGLQEGGQPAYQWVIEDPPFGYTTTQHQRDTMDAIHRLDWGTLVNTMDWGGVGYMPSAAGGADGLAMQSGRVRMPYVTDFGWLTFMNDSGGGYSGYGGYSIATMGGYGVNNTRGRRSYAWVPWPEGIPELLNRMAGVLSAGYEHAVQGMLTPPDRLYQYTGILPTTFQPQISYPYPWQVPAGR